MEKQEAKEENNKKNISPKTAVKGLINGFVAYGILIIFIFLSIVIFVAWLINNNKNAVNYDVLKYSLPAIASILIFFLIRCVCKLSTFDLFKKCQIEKEQIEAVSTKMNLFFICSVVFSVCIIIFYLLTRFNNSLITIEKNIDNYYSIYSEDLAEFKTNEILKDFELEKSDVLIQTLIIELGLLSGLFSLIPEQKKLIKKYN